MNNVWTTRVITKLGRRVARSITQSKSVFIKYCPEGTSSLFLPWFDNRPKNNALRNIALHFATVSKRGASPGLILKPHLKSRTQSFLSYMTVE